MTETTSSSEPDALLKALQKLLRPLVRLLLRNGVGLSDFTDIAKEAYVNVAYEEFRTPGRKQSLSHVL